MNIDKSNGISMTYQSCFSKSELWEHLYIALFLISEYVRNVFRTCMETFPNSIGIRKANTSYYEKKLVCDRSGLQLQYNI